MIDPEPRFCGHCQENLCHDQHQCPFCDGPTELLSDYKERRWYEQQQRLMEDGPSGPGCPETMEEYLRQKGRL